MFADSDTKRPEQRPLPQRPLTAVEDLDRTASPRGSGSNVRAQPAWFDRSVAFGADGPASSEPVDQSARFDQPSGASMPSGVVSREEFETQPPLQTRGVDPAERTVAMTTPMGPGSPQSATPVPPPGQPTSPGSYVPPASSSYEAPAAPVADSSMVTDWPPREPAPVAPAGEMAQGQTTFVPPAPPPAPNRRIGWLLAATLLAALLVIALLWAFRPDSTPSDDDAVTTTTIAGEGLSGVTTTTLRSAALFPDSPVIVPGDFSANATLVTFDGIQRTKTLVISNDTSGPVTWASSVSGTANVTLSPASGTLPAGGSQFVQVERGITAVSGSTGTIELTRSDRLSSVSVDVAIR